MKPIAEFTLGNLLNADLAVPLQCTQIFAIDRNLSFIITCQMQNESAAFIMIQINELDFTLLSYVGVVPTNISFFEVQTGRINYLQWADFSVDLVLTRNKSSSLVEIINVDFIRQTYFIKHQIKSLECPGIDNRVKTVVELQIVDFQHFDSQTMFLSDYHYGFFILGINCNQINCESWTRSYQNYTNCGQIQVPRSIKTQSIETILLQIISPAEVIIINVQDLENAFLQRIYKLYNDNQYLGLNVIDGDDDFIALIVLRFKDFKPMIRIFDRKRQFYSFGLIEFEFTDVFKPSYQLDFMKFNHIIVKGQNFVKIYQIQQPYIILNTQDLDAYQSIDKSLFNQTLQFHLNITDYQGKSLLTPFEVIFVYPTSNFTFSLLPYDKNGDHMNTYPNKIYYNCGQNRLLINQQQTKARFDLILLDPLMVGSLQDLVLQPITSEIDDYPYLQITSPNFIKLQSRDWNFTQCIQTQIVRFQVMNSYDYQLCCIFRNQFKIQFIDVIQEKTDGSKARVVENFELKDYQTKASIIDTESQFIFVFTENEDLDAKNLTMHVFRLFNQLSWQGSFQIQETLAQYFDKIDIDFSWPITYDQYTKRGILKTKRTQRDQDQFTLILFEIVMERSNFYFEVLASTDIKISNDLNISQMKIDKDQFWILFSNNTLMSYEIMEKSQIYKRFDKLPKVLYKYSVNELIINQTGDPEIDKFWSFVIKGQYILIFGAKNQIFSYRIVANQIRLSSKKILRLDYKDETYCQQNYLFVRDSNGKVIYSIYSDYIFIFFKDTFRNKTLIAAFSFSYSKFNSFVFDATLPDEFQDNPSRLKVQTVRLKTNQAEIIIMSGHASVQYLIQLDDVLSMTPENSLRLDSLCERQPPKFTLQYKVFQIGQNDSYTKIDLDVINNGLLVTKNSNYSTNITLELPKSRKIQYNDSRLDELSIYDAIVNLDEFFEGNNLNYEVRIKDNSDSYFKEPFQIEELYGGQFQLEIDFLSSKNKIIDFFVFKGFTVIFDTNGFIYVTKSIKKDPFDRKSSVDIFGCIPQLYTYFKDNFFLYQCNQTLNGSNSLQLGIAKLCTNPYEKDPNSEYASFFRDQLFIKKVKSDIKMPSKIEQSSSYFIDDNTVKIALSFNVPYQQHLSIIQVMIIEFLEGNRLNINSDNDMSITARNLNFDVFRVTSLVLMNEGKALAIGIDNQGLLLYDLEMRQQIKFINLINTMRYLDFRIQGIVIENPFTYHLLMNYYGIVTISFEGDTTQHFVESDDDYEIFTHFSFFDKEHCYSGEIAQDQKGFAFYSKLTVQNDQFEINNNQQYIIRYFSFNQKKNSQMLGFRILPAGQDCRVLRKYPESYANEYFNATLHEHYSMMAFQCESHFSFFFFNRVYQLFLKHEEQNPFKIQSLSSTQIEIVGKNDFDSKTLILQFNNQRNFLAINIALYILFIILLALFVLFSQQNFQKASKPRLKKVEVQNLNYQSIYLNTTEFELSMTIENLPNRRTYIEKFRTI